MINAGIHFDSVANSYSPDDVAIVSDFVFPLNKVLLRCRTKNCNSSLKYRRGWLPYKKYHRGWLPYKKIPWVTVMLGTVQKGTVMADYRTKGTVNCRALWLVTAASVPRTLNPVPFDTERNKTY